MKIKIKMPGPNDDELSKKVRKSKKALNKSYSSITTDDLSELLSSLGPLLLIIGIWGFNYFSARVIVGGGVLTLLLSGMTTIIVYSYIISPFRNTFGLV